MNNLQMLQNARRVLQLRQSSLPNLVVRLQSDTATGGDRPWDKSTRAVVYELPDVVSPAEIKSRQLQGFDTHSPQAFEPKMDKNVVKSRLGTHFDLNTQNWERNQNKDFRSQMRQWDIQQQAFKTSRLIRHQEYGTFNSNRGNISGRPSPSNSTPITVHQVTERQSPSNPREIQSSKAPKQISSH